MKDVVLLELAERWEREAESPEDQDGSEEAKIGNAIKQGRRACKRECADTLKVLVEMLGDQNE